MMRGVFLGLLIAMLFPFTRLVHMLSGLVAPFRYLFRSGYQIVRTRRHAPLARRGRNAATTSQARQRKTPDAQPAE